MQDHLYFVGLAPLTSSIKQPLPFNRLNSLKRQNIHNPGRYPINPICPNLMLKARGNCQDQVPDNHTQAPANHANNSSPTDLANPCAARTQEGIIRCSSRRFTPRFASRRSQTRTPKAKKFNARFFAARLPFSTLYTCLCTPDIRSPSVNPDTLIFSAK